MSSSSSSQASTELVGEDLAEVRHALLLLGLLGTAHARLTVRLTDGRLVPLARVAQIVTNHLRFCGGELDAWYRENEQDVVPPQLERYAQLFAYDAPPIHLRGGHFRRASR